MELHGRKIECITFDLDDTLWECAPVIFRAEAVFYDWLSANFPVIARDFNLDTLTAHRRRIFAEYPHKSHDFSWLRKRWLRHLAEEYGCDRSLSETGFGVFLAARNDVTMFEGVTGLLSRIKQHYRCGSITNGNADVNLVGLGDYFDFEITASGAGAAKPNPRIFAAAIDAAGVPAESILHIGDDPERDVRGALQQGMLAGWINPGGAEWPGDDPPPLELRHVTDLFGYLSASPAD